MDRNKSFGQDSDLETLLWLVRKTFLLAKSFKSLKDNSRASKTK